MSWRRGAGEHASSGRTAAVPGGARRGPVVRVHRFLPPLLPLSPAAGPAATAADVISGCTTLDLQITLHVFFSCRFGQAVHGCVVGAGFGGGGGW